MGKPIVAGAEFNLSHDGNAVLLAIGDQIVGVDIECVQDFDASMIEMCFTGDEQERIARSVHPDRVATLLWCLKEAEVKATGAGLLSGMGETGKRRLFFRGGFLTVAGLNRAYAVCSTQQISSMKISSALPRFEKVFNKFQFEDNRSCFVSCCQRQTRR
jgi:phosphopantetheinyl transferase